MNNSITKTVVRQGVILGAALCLGAGCVSTTGSAAYREANQREDQALAQEKMRRLEGDIESLTMQVDQLRRDLQRVQANSAQATDVQMSAMRSSLTSVESRIDGLEAQWKTDIKEMNTSLSHNVADLINQATASRGGGTPAPSGYGFEHIVQAGETLSRIAQAYGTTVSAITKANNIQNADTLQLGQKLIIPE